MRGIGSLGILLLLSVAMGCGWIRGRGGQGEGDLPLDPSRPPASEAFLPLKMPRATVTRLASGLKLVKAPWGQGLVHLRAVLPGGYGDESRPGVAMLSAEMASTEAGGFVPGELAEAVAKMGGDLHATVAVDHTTLAFTVPSRDAALAGQLLSLILVGPAAHPGALELARGRLEQRHAAPEASVWASMSPAVHQHIFRDLPAASPRPGPEQLAEVTLDDILAFRRGRWAPELSMVLVLGDASGEAEAAMRPVLSQWPKGGGFELEGIRPPRPEGKLVLVDVPGGELAHIIIATRAFARGSLSAMATQVMAALLTAGSGAILPAALTRAGIPASRWGYEYVGLRDSGYVELRVALPVDQAPQGLTIIFQELDRLRQSNPTPKQLAAGRHAAASRFLAELSSQDAVAEHMAFTEVNGVGSDFWDAYPQTLLAVPGDEVRKVAASLLKADRLVRVVGLEQGAASAALRAWTPPPPVKIAPVEGAP